jgi:hypothetical protein
MAKKKIKKYPLGGLAGFDDLLKGLKGNDPSKWMGMLQGFANDRGVTGFGDIAGMQNWGSQEIGMKPNNKWKLAIDGGVGGMLGMMESLQNLLPQNQRQSYNPQMFTVNPTRGYQMGGVTEEENMPVQIQAEKGEMIAFPDARISKVAAKKAHKHMHTDKVTEILPPDTLVASKDKRMTLTKGDLKKISFGYPAMEYKTDGATPEPKEMTAADIMTKDKMTPAEILKEIQRRYPDTTRERDAFAEMAREENLSSRVPYIQTVKYYTELKKPKDTKMAKYGYLIPNSQMSENPFANKLGMKDMQFKKGGVPRADLGIASLIGPIFNSLGGQLDLFMSPIKYNQNRKAINEMEKRGNKFFDTSLGELRGLQGRQMSNLGLGTLASLAPSLLASSDFATPDRSGQYSALDAMPQSVPRAYTDYLMNQTRQANRPFVQGIMRNTSSTARAMNNIGSLQGNTLNAIGNIANQNMMTDLGMRQNYLQQLGALRGQSAAEEAQKANYQTNFANQRLSNIGNVGANYFNQASNIDRSGLYSRLNLEGQRLQRTDNLSKSRLENTQQLMDAPGNYFKSVAGSATQIGSMFGQQGMQQGMQQGFPDSFNPAFSSPIQNQFLPDPSAQSLPFYNNPFNNYQMPMMMPLLPASGGMFSGNPWSMGTGFLMPR